MKAPEPPRILRRSLARNDGDSAPGSGQPGTPTLQPRQPEEQHSPAGHASRISKNEENRAQPLTAKEKLLQEVMDTLWMTCSALAELAQPDLIAGLHGIASSAFLKLSSATLRQALHPFMIVIEQGSPSYTPPLQHLASHPIQIGISHHACVAI